jgi:hypothetical protein
MALVAEIMLLRDVSSARETTDYGAAGPVA